MGARDAKSNTSHFIVYCARRQNRSGLSSQFLHCEANMATTLPLPTRTTQSQLDRSLQVLEAAHDRLLAATADELISLVEVCIYGTLRAADDWVATSSRFKGLPENSSLRAEDVMSGPVATVRHLRLLI